MYNLFRNSSAREVSAEEARDLLLRDPDIIILDVRTPEEYKGGHLKGAVNMPHSVLAFRLDEILKYKNRKILVYCQSGGRSPIAVRVLEKNGFSTIYHMIRGISSWKFEFEK